MVWFWIIIIHLVEIIGIGIFLLLRRNNALEKAVTDRKAVDSILKTGILNEKITPVLDDTNALMDLQTEVGRQETVKMIGLLKNFSNFMVGALALAIVLLTPVEVGAATESFTL